MADEKPSEVSEAAQAIAELVKAVPIYQDAIQPFAKELGKAGGSVGRAGNAVISILSELVVWGTDKCASFLLCLAKKLEATPTEQINRAAKANVIVPALEAVRLTEREPDLQELYANVIARAMDNRVADGIFPSFVEILKQLTSDEAKILKFFSDSMDKGSLVVPIVHIQQEEFDNNSNRVGGLDVVKNRSLLGGLAGCVYPKQVPSYLDNLARLGIIVFLAPGTEYANKNLYRDVEADADIEAEKRRYHRPPRFTAKFVRTGLELTTFGRHFISACVAPYGST